MLAGKVDASAIDSHVLAVELKRRPALASEIRVIQVLGPATIPPVVVSSKLPADVQTAIRDALCGLHGEDGARERLAEGLIERFVPVGDSDYDDIRRKSEVVASAHSPFGGSGLIWAACGTFAHVIVEFGKPIRKASSWCLSCDRCVTLEPYAHDRLGGWYLSPCRC